MLTNMPVRHKVTAIAVMTTTIVLFLASAVFVALEINNYRRALVQELTAIAQITSSNSTAAILFDDWVAAQETLSALQARPNIESASLYTADRRQFAHFGAPDGRDDWRAQLAADFAGPISTKSESPYALSWSLMSVDLSGPIRFDGEIIGAIHLRSSLSQIYATIETYLFVVLAIIAMAIGLAWLLAARLQTEVTRPIHGLLETMNAVSRHRNYALRAQKHGEDELGALVDGFNQMLADTEVHKTELNAARQEAESANRMKSEFLAHMSHELRTPLNAILGFSDYMLSEPMGALGHASYREYTQGIRVGGRHLLDVINNILDLSKIESGTAALHEELVDIEMVTDECVQLLSERAHSAEVEVRIETMAGLPHLFGDEQLLKRGLLNLLSNAIKFTPAGGAIVIKAEVQRSGELKLSVCDTGIGIAANLIHHVLTPFGQAENVFRRSHEGTGLGLPLVKSFVEMHGGDLALHSTPGEGTRVVMSFPAARVRLQSIEGQAEREGCVRGHVKVGPASPVAGKTAERGDRRAAALPA